MDTVPWLFMESVCLLLDRRSRERSTKVSSAWGEIFTATNKKIHTLRVILDGNTEKIYAAALPAVNIWKEITLEDLQRFVHFIRPVRNERHPLRCDYFSLSILRLRQESQWINGKLLSMRLPVDSVGLWEVKPAQFFETAGPLYDVGYYGPALKPSTLDALIEKFVPINDSSLHVHQKCFDELSVDQMSFDEFMSLLSGNFGSNVNANQSLSDKQLKKLFEKCAVANKEVTIRVTPKDSTQILDSTGPIDYDKYYSE
uniref:F-box domain-containing protein n=1 Tax=Steinernema glaseri TaxID=37863 RepID=A0A1I7ZZG8_9BILA